MRVTVTGASGLIGPALVDALADRGEEVTVLSRDPARAARRLPKASLREAWQPDREPAPARALAGRDAVVHLAGEPIAQRWSGRVRRAIRDSRVAGTENLIAGLGACPAGERPRVLLSGSAVGYYGARGEEPVDEEAPPGGDFLAQVCVAWEQRAQLAQRLDMRVVRLRTGVVLDPAGGALGKMLPPFKLGIGGPVAGGRQYVSWIHVADLIGIVLTALTDERWSSAINATAPEPATNSELSTVLGRLLHRPAVMPVPALALRLLYGEMAQIVTSGARVLPAKALVLGYEFAHPSLEEALRSALGR
jgi:uncharacterized protein